MDDTISRVAAIDALEKEKPTLFINKDGSIDPFGAGQQNQWYRDGIAIMNMPSVQPQSEIITCKDCKHRGEKPIADGRYLCERHGTFMYYCSDAERRTDE